MRFLQKWSAAVARADEAGIKPSMMEYGGQGVERYDPRIKYFEEVCGRRYMNVAGSVVTEAHRWNTAYFNRDNTEFCETCNTLDKAESYRAIIFGGKVFEKFREKLYQHCLESHPEKVKLCEL